ncbi:PadR family transcriptional regulator [Nocardia cyriacigeorgica]|nr:PadR family transcriptional regulator [Nocardia cyriacigeorgica]MBF6457190.1 PadR family transcriptional regulator [Nocardia cyriacigeorgica]MBF6478411.1 PadR family transcriptional regulator [Nocardia cyriacigeorgica]MBF6554149.1 PadR family transcriptional regulator [Nocardia cyriacigeorgica]NEW27037.1 PadR family transcriptional regulator [Nocardia cyriacigeorgica]
MASSEPEIGLVNLPPTSWAVLAMLSYEEEISGYDLKKWADWSIRYFYWSPSHSQIYSELKKLEKQGYATSRVDSDNAMRGRRLYRITDEGRAAVTQWCNEAPVDKPVLKHHVMLRIMFGHLSSPERLKEILRDHIEDIDRLRKRAAIDSAAAKSEPGWAYSQIVLQWAERHYAAERDLAQELIEQIDAADSILVKAEHDDRSEYPHPTPGRWREVEQRVQESEGAVEN